MLLKTSNVACCNESTAVNLLLHEQSKQRTKVLLPLSGILLLLNRFFTCFFLESRREAQFFLITLSLLHFLSRFFLIANISMNCALFLKSDAKV